MAPKRYQINYPPPSTNLPGFIDHAVKVMNVIQHELELNPEDTQIYQEKVSNFIDDLMSIQGDEISRKIEDLRGQSIIDESEQTDLEYESMRRKSK